jgi:hypothetical protein
VTKIHVSVYGSTYSTCPFAKYAVFARDHGSATSIIMKRLGFTAWDHIDARDARPDEEGFLRSDAIGS